MALRNQPYIPLYVQDFQTDEKLMECSAQATGVYIRIMCVMHKSEHYGKILLKQNDKQSVKQENNFAAKLAKFLPYSTDVVLAALNELLDNGVLKIDGDFLIQKRMVKDNSISENRAKAGKKGGDKTATNFAKAKTKAKGKANSENENEIVNEVENRIELVYPFNSEKFKQAWATLIKEPKWKKKTQTALQLSLKKLSQYPEPVAIEMIANTIAGGWQGLFEIQKKSTNNERQTREQERNAEAEAILRKYSA